MQTVVIYHRADFDGLFCREIAKKFMPDAKLIGWDYGDPVPVVDGDANIYIMDLSIPELMGHPYLIWIDHHATAIAQFPANIRGYRIDGVAACRLAWQWFNLDATFRPNGLPKKIAYVERLVGEPLAVRLAGEYDIWDKRDPDAELLQHGLKSRNLDNVWQHLLRPQGIDFVIELLDAGKVIAYVREQEYAQVIEEQGFTIKWEGLTFLACNSHELDIRSHLFAAGIRPEHDALMGFTWNGVQRAWRISLYGVPGKPDVDCSVIAKKYGGGGHKQACGFKIAQLPFELRNSCIRSVAQWKDSVKEFEAGEKYIEQTEGTFEIQMAEIFTAHERRRMDEARHLFVFDDAGVVIGMKESV